MDTGKTMGMDYDPSVVPPNPDQGPLMQTLMPGQASAEQKARFGSMWQDRVENILTSEDLWPRLVAYTLDD